MSPSKMLAMFQARGSLPRTAGAAAPVADAAKEAAPVAASAPAAMKKRKAMIFGGRQGLGQAGY